MNDQAENRDLALEIKFRIRPTNRVEFLQTADSLMTASSAEPDLRALDCFEQVGAENTFLWRERWPSEKDLEARLETTTLKTLMGAIGVLGELEALEVLRHRRARSGKRAKRPVRS